MRATVRSKAFRSIVAAAVVVTAGAGLVRAAGLLDGRRFKVEDGEKGKPKAEDDELVFAAGTLRSKACDTYGFKAGAYKATTKSGVIAFEAVTASAKEGQIRWSGTVTGDRIEGRYVWTKAGQADIEYWLKGQAVK